VRFFIPVLLLLAVVFSGAGPQAIVDESTFDFGEIEEDPEATHHFMIRNEGDSTLHIINVRSS
jgi:hypothetical protein